MTQNPTTQDTTTQTTTSGETPPARSILILGATGGIGGAVARTMLQRGWTVRALVRNPDAARRAWSAPAGLQWVQGDALVADDVLRAAQGTSVILHAVNPPGYRNWGQLVLPMLDNTIAAARATKARVVLPGTIYNYAVAETPLIAETTPQRAGGAKGLIRVEMERKLAAAAPEVKSLIVRAGDFFGPGVAQSWFAQALAKPPLARMLNPGKPGIGHSWAYVPDLAETMARLMETPDLAPAEQVQFEGVWDADGTGMAQAIRRVVGKPALPLKPFPWWLMRLLAPFGGFPSEVMEVLPLWRHPVRLDNRRLVSLLGAEPRTPIDTAVAAALRPAAA